MMCGFLGHPPSQQLLSLSLRAVQLPFRFDSGVNFMQLHVVQRLDLMQLPFLFVLQASFYLCWLDFAFLHV